MKTGKPNTSILNKKALHDYEVVERFEAGIKLTGPEVKSLRLGQASLRESHVVITGAGVQLLNMNITPYKFARQEDCDPQRSRQLLLHQREIERLKSKAEQKGLTLVPIKVYLKGNRYKVEVGVVRGRKQYEKREMLKRRDIERDTQRLIKDRRY